MTDEHATSSTSRRDWMRDGVSYPVVRDKQSKLLWLLTSRRVNTLDADENGDPIVRETTQQTWGESFKWNIWMGSKPWRWHFRLVDVKEPCGCSHHRFTRKSRGMCLDHLIEKRFPEGLPEEVS